MRDMRVSLLRIGRQVKTMKRACVWLCLAAMLMSGDAAGAEFRATGVKQACYMRMRVYTTDEGIFRLGTRWSLKDCGADNHAVFVRHYVPHDTMPYTNLFRVCKVDEDGSVLSVHGEKWCTPGLNVPISSDDIEMNEYYTVKARGNTMHYEYDGVERIELRVNMYVNMDEVPGEKKVTDDDTDHAIFD